MFRWSPCDVICNALKRTLRFVLHCMGVEHGHSMEHTVMCGVAPWALCQCMVWCIGVGSSAMHCIGNIGGMAVFGHAWHNAWLCLGTGTTARAPCMRALRRILPCMVWRTGGVGSNFPMHFTGTMKLRALSYDELTMGVVWGMAMQGCDVSKVALFGFPPCLQKKLRLCVFA